jgi:hypothetical protein
VGVLFFSETDIATQKRLQQFSSLLTGVVVDSSTGDVGYFRVIPGTNQAIRLPESNITVFTDPDHPIPEEGQDRRPVAATPTVEVRRRIRKATNMTQRAALTIILIALVISIGVFSVVLYKYYASTSVTPVTILHEPVSTATVGTSIQILTNVTGPGRNVTLVYGVTNEQTENQVLMNSVAPDEYSYLIPAGQVTGNIAYYIKAYYPAGRQVNTTVYRIAVADFRLQPQSDAVTVYRTEGASLEIQLLSINNFNGPVALSTTGNPSGLVVGFSRNPAMSGTVVAMNITANADVPNGTYPVTLVGTYAASKGSQVTRQSALSITVADFQVAVAPASDEVQPGSTATFTITLTLEKGFVDTVTVANVSGLPQSATYTVAASNPTVLGGGPGTTKLTIQVKTLEFTKAGTYTIRILISGGGITHYLTAQIIVR